MVSKGHAGVRRVARTLLAVAVAASLSFPAGAWAIGSARTDLDADAAADGFLQDDGGSRADDAGEVSVVFTNDVHCAVEDGLGYAGVAAFVDDAEAAYGEQNVTLVDAGDAIQGDVVGTLTDGEAIVKIMSYLDYDYAVPGNHEFDYGRDRLFELADESSAEYLSCNFTDLRTGKTPFAPFAIETYPDVVVDGDDLDVAYVGITTPETLTKSRPASFQDGTGAYVYGFCEDATGEALYASVQGAVDAARAQGADYVVAVGHLGRTGITDRWTSDAVIANTTGIDAFIDGHSHEQYVTEVENEAGQAVPLAQTGTKLTAVGKLVIDPDADETAGESELSFSLTQAQDYAARAADATEFIDGVMADFETELAHVVGRSDVELVSEDAKTGTYVRYQETNLGDLVADAYRSALGADIGLVNGGGVRASIKAGDVTYADLVSVQPFGNELCLVRATGQQILDALEMGVSKYPEPSGGFLQVSGLSYTVRTDVDSSVVLDEHGGFAGVDGPRRVEDVRVAGEPIDPAATYTVASHSFLLTEGGDGMTMFDDAELLLDRVMIDNQALIDYIANDLGGVIGQAYANAEGDGRIVFADGPTAEDPSGEGESGTPADPSSSDDQAASPDAGEGGSGSSEQTEPLAKTGDGAVALAVSAIAVAVAAGSVAAVARIRLARKNESVED